MSSHELVINLLDSLWFEFEILKPKPPSSSPSIPDKPPKEPLLDEIQGELNFDDEDYGNPSLPRATTMKTRSHSDLCLGSEGFSCSGDDFSSPNSVLLPPKLETILSGKQVGDFSEQPAAEGNDVAVKRRERDGRRRGKRGTKGSSTASKSLSELEFEEMKGFMDLGFVFSEEDKNSSLVSIIPGLQRLGRGGEEEEEESVGGEKAGDGNSKSWPVPRPYLSEAWDFADDGGRKEATKPLANWKIPSSANELEMKDMLRFWAHTVASNVR